MSVERATIRDLCTEAVFDRGENYYAEGRISACTRVGDTVTATVRGSRPYDLRLSLSAADFAPSCPCPYDGPGECKHVVAVLLSLADGLPADEGDRTDAILEDVDGDDLRAFVREELARDTDLRERFFARFGAEGRSSEAYRDAVEDLFTEHTREYPVVVEAIDFGHFTDLGAEYRERGQYRQAAAVYRGLVAGIDDNIQLVDAAYDHYATVFGDALDAYVECVVSADLDSAVSEEHEAWLAERATTGSEVHREQFERALTTLRSATDE